MASDAISQAIQTANDYQNAGKPAEAEALLRKLATQNPNHRDPHFHLALFLKTNDRLDEAIQVYRRAVEIDPTFVPAWNNLAMGLNAQGKSDDAIVAYRRAFALNPNNLEVCNNLGFVLTSQGKLDEAMQYFNRALAINGNHPYVRWNRSLTLLIRGQFEEGWREYEWRWDATNLPSPYRKPVPIWNGQEMRGQRILLYVEQGFGDALQFVRYVPMVAQLGPKIILACHEPLRRLFASVEGFQLLAAGEDIIPPHEWQCPLVSLPLAFKTTLATIPNRVPYVKADDERVKFWRERLAADQKFKVGLCWAGNPTTVALRRRHLPLSAFAPLAQIPGVNFYSLQKGDGSEQAANPPAGMNLVDHTNELTDFAETAALMMNLDLVISVDTAAVHLAGALGRNVWTLLPFAPDWRWMLNRNDSPWYPTMRLFRQPKAGDWPSVVADVVRELREIQAMK